MTDELVDVGYRDPCDDRDDVREPPPARAEYDDEPQRHPVTVAARAPAIGELSRDELEQLLAFGAGVEQVLARTELERRAGAGYQPSLLTAAQRAAETAPPRRR